MKILRNLIIALSAVALVTACEGPMGPVGDNGVDGVDANESCIQCHNNQVVDAKMLEYEHSVHFEGEAFEEGTRAGCAPCHSHQGFLYVVKNNTASTFVPDPANAGRFLNSYSVDAATASLPGGISCITCHSSVHTTYKFDDFFPLTTQAAVPMTMWGGAKTIDFSKKSSNLCTKCHQPRPVTASTGNVIAYSTLVSAPATNYNLSTIGYRTGIHYGAQGAMAAGQGGVEFGTGYTNSAHTANASCSSCHMSSPSGMSGGHSFISNFTGCNVTGCHTTMSATNATYTAAVADINTKIGQLAAKLNALGNGHDILEKDATDGQYHGYIDIYDAGSNSDAYWRNPSQGNVTFPTLTNAQFGALINLQLVIRDGSHGVHNYPYMKKLLENSLAAW